jgi:hypothetical protein
LSPQSSSLVEFRWTKWQTPKAAREATLEVSEAMGATLEKAMDAAHSGSERATQMAGAARDGKRKVKGAADKAVAQTRRVTDAAQRGRVRTGRLGADLGGRTRELPFSSLLVAGAVGYVLATLLRRRR